jgi:hypothetical protein
MAKPRLAQAKQAADSMILMNLTAGKIVSQALAVAAELGIADLLKDGAKSAADIARAANASEDGVYRVLRAWQAWVSSLRPENGDSGSLRSASCSAPTRPKRWAAMRDS